MGGLGYRLLPEEYKYRSCFEVASKKSETTQTFVGVGTILRHLIIIISCLSAVLDPCFELCIVVPRVADDGCCAIYSTASKYSTDGGRVAVGWKGGSGGSRWPEDNNRGGKWLGRALPVVGNKIAVLMRPVEGRTWGHVARKQCRGQC